MGERGRFGGTRTWVLLALAVVLASAAHRATKIDHSFFGDEVWVISDVREGRYVPHAIPQPPLFFYSEVLASRLCGFGETCLRVPAQVFAFLLTLVPLFMLRRSTLLTPAGAVMWCALLGFCSVLVFYSGRTKQYTLEALAAAVLLWLFSRAVDDPKMWWPFAAAGAIIVLSLHSPVFILLATGTAGFVAAREWRTRWRIAAIHAGLAALFLFAYFAYLSPGAAVDERFGDLHDYFRDNNLPVFWDGSIGFAVRQTAVWLGQMLNLTSGFVPVAGIVILAWLASLAAKRRREAAAVAFVCLAPPLFVLVASSTTAYPYSELRLMAFLAPGLMLAIALAFQWLILQRNAMRWVGAAAAVILTGAFIVQQVRTDPYNRTYMRVADLRPAYAFLRAQNVGATPVLCRKFDCTPLALYLGMDERRMVRVMDGSPADAAKPLTMFWSLLDARDEETLRNAGFVPLRRFVCEDRIVTLWRH